MWPPVGSVPVNGAELTFDDERAPVGWRRLRYRAVAWTADDDLAGQVGSRSPASAAVSALLPPAEPPTIVELSVNEAGSTDAKCLVWWKSDAPVPPTPLGPHSAVVETTDEAGNLRTLRGSAAVSSFPNGTRAFWGPTKRPRPE